MEPRLLNTEVLDNPRDFAALEEEWDELYRDAPLATPFQSWAWLYTWWEFYGEGHELRIVTVRHQGRLVGLVPLALKRRRGFGRLLFIGSRETDYLDMLVRQGWEDVASEAVTRCLWRMDSWHVADLQDLRPTAAAWGLFRSWDGPRTHTWQENCPVIDAKPWEEILSGLSKNLRKTARRTVQRLEADGVRCELAGSADMERAASRWIALHREAWQGRDIAPVNLTRKFELHLRTAASRMTARNLGGIAECWRGGEVIVSTFWVFGDEFVGSYLLGATQEALQRYQVSSLYIWNGMNLARARNSPCLDLMRGDEPYKLRWNPSIVTSRRILLGRNPIVLLPYAGYRSLRLRARRYTDSENTPPSIRALLNKLRGR